MQKSKNFQINLEYLCLTKLKIYYVIGSNLLEEELENISHVSTSKANAIDGIIILVNGRLISDENDLKKIGDNEKINLEIGFVQSTLQGSFDMAKFQAYIDGVVNFLTDALQIEPYSSILKKLLDENGDYINNFDDTPKVSLFFVSGRTSHNLSPEDISKEEQKINQRQELIGKFILKKINVLQKEEIKLEYDKIPKYHSTQLKFEKNVQLENSTDIEFSLLATIKFSELKKLILTSNGKLRERLFIENVRNFIGNTEVNKDIRSTLNDESTIKFFPYLNNGLTIMCDSIERHKVKQDEFILTFPRIINGCQTTHILYEEFIANPNMEDVDIVSKIISTTNNDLKKKIIFAANNQNSIQKDLQSLNNFHEKIEQHFAGIEGINLYFERLRGQHSQVSPPYSKINIENLAKIYISVFKKEPHKMKSNAISIIEQYQKENKIFNDDKTIPDYYYCGMLYYYLNSFVLNNKIQLKSRTVDMHLLMACDILIEKKGIVDIIENWVYRSYPLYR